MCKWILFRLRPKIVHKIGDNRRWIYLFASFVELSHFHRMRVELMQGAAKPKTIVMRLGCRVKLLVNDVRRTKCSPVHQRRKKNHARRKCSHITHARKHFNQNPFFVVPIPKMKIDCVVLSDFFRSCLLTDSLRSMLVHLLVFLFVFCLSRLIRFASMRITSPLQHYTK